MFKLYVFTLNFTASVSQKLHDTYPKFSPMVKSLIPPLHSQKDASGFFQVFQTTQLNILDEPLEINCFTRSFSQALEVMPAITQGCPNIRRFYHLISEIKSKENIYVLCRVVIHGSVGNQGGFAMESLFDTEYKQITVTPRVIAKIIINSMPVQARGIFTSQSPLNLQLVSCSAGGAYRYFQLEQNSLASSLSQSLLAGNIFTKIQAATTSVLLPHDFSYFITSSSMSKKSQFTDIESSLDAVFGEYYYRRGVGRAISHIKREFDAKGELDRMFFLNEVFLKNSSSPVFLNMSEIITSQKTGYKLIYISRSSGSITVTDYVTKREFIHPDDIKLEADRDDLLEYLWVCVFYDFLTIIDGKYSKYCVPVAPEEILKFIDEIEEARSMVQVKTLFSYFKGLLKSRLYDIEKMKKTFLSPSDLLSNFARIK